MIARTVFQFWSEHYVTNLHRMSLALYHWLFDKRLSSSYLELLISNHLITFSQVSWFLENLLIFNIFNFWAKNCLFSKHSVIQGQSPPAWRKKNPSPLLLTFPTPWVPRILSPWMADDTKITVPLIPGGGGGCRGGEDTMQKLMFVSRWLCLRLFSKIG